MGLLAKKTGLEAALKNVSGLKRRNAKTQEKTTPVSGVRKTDPLTYDEMVEMLPEELFDRITSNLTKGFSYVYVEVPGDLSAEVIADVMERSGKLPTNLAQPLLRTYYVPKGSKEKMLVFVFPVFVKPSVAEKAEAAKSVRPGPPKAGK